MKTSILTLALSSALLTAGCSVRDCGSDSAYLQVEPAGAFVVPEGVTLAPASPAYLIPRGGEGELVLGEDYTDAQGKTRRGCLYEPPRMDLPPEPAAPAPEEEGLGDQG